MKTRAALALPGLPLFLLLFPAPAPARPPAPLVRLDLGGSWEFHVAGQKKWYPAHVPGCVHTDLLAAGLIPDPFYRTNERDLQWIDKVDWEYRKTFTAGEEILSRERVRLVFQGLDTYARVYLNGALLLRADNMFRTWSADCRPFLRKGPNTILVRFRSPVTKDLPRRLDLGYQLPGPGWGWIGGLGKLGISMFARKAQYQYGWDWGPRLVTSGIWRPVRLEAWDRARIESVQYLVRSLTPKEARLTARVEVRGTRPGKALLSILVKGTDLPAFTREIDLAEGTGTYSLDLAIPRPRLWWTNGLGEPHLYTLEAVLSGEGLVLDRRSTRIGLRTLRLVRKKSMGGKSFYFELNGIPLYCKGADWIPADSFPSRVTPGKYEFLVKSAAAAHMNMLRVWGGGIYENDLFYDLCDRYGILVWQDFMFACAMYPGDAAFVENVTREAVQAVKRLRNHPCLALWCGNNEMDAGLGPWGWMKNFDPEIRKKITADYDRLFHLVLPKVVSAYDPTRSYWPSSPLADWGVHASIQARSGDYHYWGVWHG
ncbi:MAG TPA: glycoside hydrolase family 2 protein, partial [Planctomycetes bacterium]|nr:glycoside hydrolase family 2 protein [Planctomycetota bacterium]